MSINVVIFDTPFNQRRATLLKTSTRTASLLALILIMTLTACGSTSSNNGGSSNKISLKELNFGLIPLDNATKEINDTQPLADALSKKLGIPVHLTVGVSYTATIEALASHKIDIALFGPFSYILAHSKYGIDAILRVLSSNDGKPTYNSLIITRPDTGIKTMTDLKGHTFSYVDVASTSGYLVPQYMLKQAGLDPKNDVQGTFVGNHVASLTAVLQKKVDAGAVASDTFAQQKAAGLYKDGDVVIVQKSFDIPQGPLGVNKDMSAKDRQFIVNAFTSITDQTILQKAGNAGFIVGQDGDYNNLRDVANQLGIDVSTLVK
jgi:phosphonate transport system substrate-binding protein